MQCASSLYVPWLIVTFTATHCSTLQHTATHCNTLQHTAKICLIIIRAMTHRYIDAFMHAYAAVCSSVLQCVAVCSSVLQCAALCCSLLQCVAVWCSVLQCVAVCCSVLQSFMRATWPSLSHITHASFVCVTNSVMTHSCMRHVSSLNVTWLTHTRDMTHTYPSHQSHHAHA